MNEQISGNEWLNEQWHINLDWYKNNGCSFLVLAQDSLCPKCRRKFKNEARPEEVLKAIAGCCAKKDDFITAGMPLMSAVFRYFLARNNQPVEIEQLSRELSELRGTRARTSPAVLRRLLLNDRYYGLARIDDKVAETAG